MKMKFKYEIENGEDTYDIFIYEPTTEELKRALAVCIIKNASVKPVKDYIDLVINIIDNHDLVYDDNFLQYYEEDLQAELEDAAFKYYEEL